jgi:hypothetical protein
MHTLAPSKVTLYHTQPPGLHFLPTTRVQGHHNASDDVVDHPKGFPLVQLRHLDSEVE